MSNMHVLAQLGGRYRIALHIAIPTGNNSASPAVSWRTAVVASGLGGKTVLPVHDTNPASITTTEKALVDSGAIYEEVVDWDVTRNGALSGAAILTYMDELYNLRSAEVLALLQVQLAQFGRVR